MSVINISIVVGVTGLLFSFVLIRAGDYSPKTKDALLKYLLNGDNHLSQLDSINSVHYELVYWPQELIDNRPFSSQNVGINKRRSDTELFLLLRCSYRNNDLLNAPNSEYNFTKVLNNISFNLSKYIFAILDKKDTCQLKNSIYARNYGMTNNTDVLLYFDGLSPFKSCEIVIRDFVFEQTESIKLKFFHQDIINCPELKIKK